MKFKTSNKFCYLPNKYKILIYDLITLKNDDYVISRCLWFWNNINTINNINEI